VAAERRRGAGVGGSSITILRLDPLQHLSARTWLLPGGQASFRRVLEHILAARQTRLDQFLAGRHRGHRRADVSLPPFPANQGGIDRVFRGGEDVRYDENGVHGLAGGKKLIIAPPRVAAYTGLYAAGGADHQETYLALGVPVPWIPTITFVRA